MKLPLKRLVKKPQLLAVGILLVGGVAGGLIVFWPQKSETATTKSLQQCQNTAQFKCYADYFAAATKANGSVPALGELKAIQTTDTYAKAECHEFTHVIGRTAYDKYGSLPAAYAQGDSICWSGFYHGVTERAIGLLGAQGVKDKANSICDELANRKAYSFDHYNCAHGLGHGFYTVANANLFDGLKTCDILTDTWERESCYGGVYMENVMTETRGGTSNYLKPDQPLYPCTVVESTYKQQCYLMQSSYILQHNNYDFAAAFEACRTTPDQAYVETCYQSIGRDASGSTTSDVARTTQNCLKTTNPTGIEQCMLGAVRDFISYYHSDQQAKTLCKAFDPSLLSRCEQEITSYYSTF